MQLAGSMYSILSPSWKHSIGQTATQSVYLQPTQGSVTTKAMFISSFKFGRKTPRPNAHAPRGAKTDTAGQEKNQRRRRTLGCVPPRDRGGEAEACCSQILST